MILGLDISTRMTGATVFDDKGKMILNTVWDTRNKNKFPDHFSKADFIRDSLLQIKSESDILGIYIEKPFMFFSSGLSTAKTMSSLQSFNGMISWICKDMYGVKPKYFTAMQSRKIVGVKIKKGENSKIKVAEYVVDNQPGFVVEYTKSGNLKAGESDKADSWIIAKAGLITWKNKEKF